MPDNLILIIGVLIVGAALLGGLVDIAFLGIMVRAWAFGPARATPRPGEESIIHHRFGKTGLILGAIVGWVFAPWEVFVTNRRLLVNYRNAYARLDIPIDSIRTVRVSRRPWPMADDILIGYSDRGTAKQFFFSDDAGVIVRALKDAGAKITEIR